MIRVQDRLLNGSMGKMWGMFTGVVEETRTRCMVESGTPVGRDLPIVDECSPLVKGRARVPEDRLIASAKPRLTIPSTPSTPRHDTPLFPAGPKQSIKPTIAFFLRINFVIGQLCALASSHNPSHVWRLRRRLRF
jgi:hypothetical protein